MMSLEKKDSNILTTDKDGTEAIAGTMADVKLKIMEKMGLTHGCKNCFRPKSHLANSSFIFSDSPLSHSREHLVQFTPTTIEQLPPRSMQDSFTSAIIPLGSDIYLRDKYIGFLGNVRLGKKFSRKLGL